eukprot:3434263-Pyramimonas_sp.AAC.1
MSESLKTNGRGKPIIAPSATSMRGGPAGGTRFQAVHGIPSWPGAELLSPQVRFSILSSDGASIWEQS